MPLKTSSTSTNPVELIQSTLETMKKYIINPLRDHIASIQLNHDGAMKLYLTTNAHIDILDDAIECFNSYSKYRNLDIKQRLLKIQLMNKLMDAYKELDEVVRLYLSQNVTYDFLPKHLAQTLNNVLSLYKSSDVQNEASAIPLDTASSTVGTIATASSTVDIKSVEQIMSELFSNETSSGTSKKKKQPANNLSSKTSNHNANKVSKSKDVTLKLREETVISPEDIPTTNTSIAISNESSKVSLTKSKKNKSKSKGQEEQDSKIDNAKKVSEDVTLKQNAEETATSREDIPTTDMSFESITIPNETAAVVSLITEQPIHTNISNMHGDLVESIAISNESSKAPVTKSKKNKGQQEEDSKIDNANKASNDLTLKPNEHTTDNVNALNESNIGPCNVDILDTKGDTSKSTDVVSKITNFDDINYNDDSNWQIVQHNVKFNPLDNSNSVVQVNDNKYSMNYYTPPQFKQKLRAIKQQWVNATKQNKNLYFPTSQGGKIDIAEFTEDQLDVYSLTYMICKVYSHVGGKYPMKNDRIDMTTPIEPFRNHKHPKDEIGLAGLLTYDLEEQACTVIAIVNTIKGPKLLIANQAVNNTNGMKDCFYALQKYFINGSAAGYQDLMNWAKGLVDYKLQNDKKLLKMIDNIFHGHYPANTSTEWIGFSNSLECKQKPWLKKFVDLILRPITDCMRIAKGFSEGTMSEHLIKAIKDFDGDINNSLSVKYLSDYTESMHPDMKILTTLIKMLHDKLITTKQEISVSASKLLCGICSTAFKITEEYSKQICKDDIKFDTQGTSGNTIPSFIAPKDVAPYLVKVLKEFVVPDNSVPTYRPLGIEANTEDNMPFNLTDYTSSFNIMGNHFHGPE